MDETKLYIIYTIVFMWLIGLTTALIIIRSNLTLLELLIKIKKIIFNKGRYTDKQEVEELMRTAGYDYDAEQDIFYSREDAWQKSYGYCRLYDEAASAFSMVMDSEPIYFEYDNRRWLIEFWKGQYGMCTGAEVGVYQTKKGENKFKNLFDSTLYEANDREDITIKVELLKNEKKLFTREDSYWWITGFILGEYSEPNELSMNIEIVFPNKRMLNAFLKGLRSAGYFDEEFEVKGNMVTIEFNEPHTVQPRGRIEKMDNLQQLKNKMSCEQYKVLRDPNLNSFDNLIIIKEKQSEIFDSIVDLAKSHEIGYIYENAKRYIE